MKKIQMNLLICIITTAMWLPTLVQHQCFSQERNTNRPLTYNNEITTLIDTPTGGLVNPRTFDAGLRIFPQGGRLAHR